MCKKLRDFFFFFKDSLKFAKTHEVGAERGCLLKVGKGAPDLLPPRPQVKTRVAQKLRKEKIRKTHEEEEEGRSEENAIIRRDGAR